MCRFLYFLISLLPLGIGIEFLLNLIKICVKLKELRGSDVRAAAPLNGWSEMTEIIAGTGFRASKIAF